MIVYCIFVVQVSIIFPKEVEELAKQLGSVKLIPKTKQVQSLGDRFPANGYVLFDFSLPLQGK